MAQEKEDSQSPSTSTTLFEHKAKNECQKKITTMYSGMV